MTLRSNGVRTVIATGCTTEGCVDSTIRDAGFLDYYAVAVTDCVGSDDRGLHASAMHILGSYRCELTDSRALARVWGRERPSR